ncbi:MAG: hypothetical protein JWM43_1725 [Acidobacteriaceae bacterium]|nr:hypothetical protein [Acidobacteriaceae bacterium]
MSRLLFYLGLICLVGSGGPSAAIAQDTPAAAVAPVPPGLSAGKKVFLSNGGGDSGLFPHPFSGNQQRGYDSFYAAMTRWGRYELVNDPAEADLVFELHLIAPSGPANADKSKGASDPLPMFRLVIFDRKTHYALWALTTAIERAALQKTHDRNFDDAVNTLIANLKVLVTQKAGQMP